MIGDIDSLQMVVAVVNLRRDSVFYMNKYEMCAAGVDFGFVYI